MKTAVRPQITLVGAGPGDPELISLKGVKALAQAKVVLYDALVHPDILKYASAKALKIYVGKRAGQHKFPQEQINQMLVEYAFEYGEVVRLKGGDPFIFGRGHEELTYAKSFDLPVQIIPGISSIQLSALQATPLTCRGINESFWVVTGTTRAGQVSKDMQLAAQSSATVVVLMGVRKLPNIVSIYQKLGKGAMPIMMIQNGSRAEEKVVIGRIDGIEELVKEKRIKPPAIMVIGEVVSLHPDFVYEQALLQVESAIPSAAE